MVGWFPYTHRPLVPDLHCGSVDAGAARRRRYGTRRGAARDGAAPRLGNSLCQRSALSGKSPAHVLERRDQLHDVRCERVGHAPASDAGRAGDDPGNVWPWPVGIRIQWGIRFGPRAGDGVRAISFHALHDSGRAGWPLADPDVLVLSAVARTRPALAPGVLGGGSGLRIERVDQGHDWVGVSWGGDRNLSAADGKSEAPVEAAPALQLSGVSG